MNNDAIFSLTPVSAYDNVNTEAKPCNQNRGGTVINLPKPTPSFNPSLNIISHLYLFLNNVSSVWTIIEKEYCLSQNLMVLVSHNIDLHKFYARIQYENLAHCLF